MRSVVSDIDASGLKIGQCSPLAKYALSWCVHRFEKLELYGRDLWIPPPGIALVPRLSCMDDSCARGGSLVFSSHGSLPRPWLNGWGPIKGATDSLTARVNNRFEPHPLAEIPSNPSPSCQPIGGECRRDVTRSPVLMTRCTPTDIAVIEGDPKESFFVLVLVRSGLFWSDLREGGLYFKIAVPSG